MIDPIYKIVKIKDLNESVENISNDNFSDYELYQILEMNGYKTTDKNLQILKESLTSGKYKIITESTKLAKIIAKKEILFLFGKLKAFGFKKDENTSIDIYPESWNSWEVCITMYNNDHDRISIFKLKNGKFDYCFETNSVERYMKRFFYNKSYYQSDLYYKTIMSSKKYKYEDRYYGEDGGIDRNTLINKLTLILKDIKEKRDLLCATPPEKILNNTLQKSIKEIKNANSTSNEPYILIQNKIFDDIDEIRLLAKKLKKDIITRTTMCDWDERDEPDITGWVFTFKLDNAALPPVATANDAIYMYLKYKKYNIWPYFDWEGARDPIIKRSGKGFAANRSLDDDHIFIAYSGDGDCYDYSGRTLKVTKGESHRH